MSLWQQTRLLPANALQSIQCYYNQSNLPFFVRQNFADLLENLLCDPSHPPQYVLEKVINSLTQRLSKEPKGSVFRTSLEAALNTIIRDYTPEHLVSTIKRCLMFEQDTVRQHTDVLYARDIGREIGSSLEILHERNRKTEYSLRQIDQELSTFIPQYQSACGASVDTAESNVNKKLDFSMRIQELSQEYYTTIQNLDAVRRDVMETELLQWKRLQQLAGNGAPLDKRRLDTLQKWCEDLSELIWQTKEQILHLEVIVNRQPIDFPNISTSYYLQELKTKIVNLLTSLVQSSFIVGVQPPQVLKRDARFNAVVYLLTGDKLEIESNPIVNASILNESQAIEFCQNNKLQKSGAIDKNACSLNLNQETGLLTGVLKHMVLTKISRTEKKSGSSEAVTEEKFCILFQSVVKVGREKLQIPINAISLPIVVTVHGNQECNAMATILWNNQFRDVNSTQFRVCDQAPLSQVLDILTTKFESVAGKPLTEENKYFLATKILNRMPDREFHNILVTWEMFNRAHLPLKKYTFWQWFYCVMKLTMDHLKGPWAEGLIVGFIGKEETKERLQNCPKGTFLLRFSDNFLGHITIGWTGRDEVMFVNPYDGKQLSNHGIAEIVKDVKKFVTLYPNTPKSIFDKFLKVPSTFNEKKEDPKKYGYVKSKLKEQIEDGEDDDGATSSITVLSEFLMDYDLDEASSMTIDYEDF